MKKLLQFGFAFCMVLLLQVSCSKKKFEKPADPTSPPVVTCDTVSVPMSYSIHIKPILVGNCGTNGCHDSVNHFGSWDLSVCTTSLNNGVQACAITNNQLLGAITHSTNVNQPMPIGGKLQDCEIAKIRNWIQQGAKDN